MSRRKQEEAVPVRLTKLTVDIPVELETRVHGLARMEGVPKRAMVVRLLDQGCGNITPTAGSGRSRRR